VLGQDDKGLYNVEQLKNLNRYYFLPFLDEKIQFREEIKPNVEERRQELRRLMEEWNDLRMKKEIVEDEMR
jgi:hypothetical protein